MGGFLRYKRELYRPPKVDRVQFHELRDQLLQLVFEELDRIGFRVPERSPTSRRRRFCATSPCVVCSLSEASMKRIEGIISERKEEITDAWKRHFSG